MFSQRWANYLKNYCNLDIFTYDICLLNLAILMVKFWNFRRHTHQPLLTIRVHLFILFKKFISRLSQAEANAQGDLQSFIIKYKVSQQVKRKTSNKASKY